MSEHLPHVVIRRPKVPQGGVRNAQGSTVLINGFPVPCVTAVLVQAEAGPGPGLWELTLTLGVADVTFEDQE